MKIRFRFALSLTLGLLATQPAHALVGTLADSNGEVVAWGRNDIGQATVPSGTYTAVAAGFAFSLGIRSDGTLAGWGDNSSFQTSVPSGTFSAVSAGPGHSLGIRSDGTLAGWGNNGVCEICVPSGTFSAIAAGGGHGLGLRTDRTLAGWGFNQHGQTTVPSGTFSAIAAGGDHSLGLRTDGTLAGWGNNPFGQTTVPSGTFVAIATGDQHSLGIRSDGTLAGWGLDGNGQATVPNGAFTAIAAGDFHSLGLRVNGTLAGWGNNPFGQTTVPSGTFVAIEAGHGHSLALRARTEYDGDLLIAEGGVKANLNRSVHVAGDVILDYFPIRASNVPTVMAEGKLVIGLNAGFNFINPGTANATFQTHGLELRRGWAITPEFPILNTGPLSGGNEFAPLHLTQSQLQIGLAPTSTFGGYIYTDAQSSVVISGTGYQEVRAWHSGSDFTAAGNRQIIPGGELRMGPGQRVRFTTTAATEPINQPGPSTYFTSNYNGGKIELLGNLTSPSEVEFTGSLHNAAGTGLITGHDAILRFTGGVDNRGAISLTRGVNDVSGDITNAAGGTITVTGGADAVFYDDVVQNGTLRVAKVGSTTSTAVFLGSFTGSGGSTGGGDIFFEGDLRPGNSPAAVTFNNNVSFGSGSATMMELAGTTPGSGYDQMLVSGALSLDGTLNVSLLNSFTPSSGQSFNLFDWTSLSGTFASINLPTLGGGLTWNTSQLYTTGVLSVLGGLDGDFNDDGFYNCADINALTATIAAGSNNGSFDLTGDGNVNLADRDAWLSEAGGVNIGPGRVYRTGDANLDGVVDGSDFGVWNSGKFTSNTAWCSGNFNGDAVVDGSDFGIWNSNKFTSSDSTSVVPEPSGFVGLLVVLGGFLVRRGT